MQRQIIVITGLAIYQGKICLRFVDISLRSICFDYGILKVVFDMDSEGTLMVLIVFILDVILRSEHEDFEAIGNITYE